MEGKAVIWITGASSGIGEACAYQYAAQGNRLILTSSSEERLAPVAARCMELGAAGAEVLAYDLSDTSGISELVRKAWGLFGKIDILFCNAGISQRTTVMDTSMEMTRKIMEINYFAPVAMASAILPLMLGNSEAADKEQSVDGGKKLSPEIAGGQEADGERPSRCGCGQKADGVRGQIAVTTSIAGKFGFPLRCAYGSSKSALQTWFETLQAEYYSQGIRVTLVCPGRVRTNISWYALDKGGQRHGKMDAGQANGLSAEKAARKITKAIARRKSEVLVGRYELLMVYIKRFFPRLCGLLARKVSAV